MNHPYFTTARLRELESSLSHRDFSVLRSVAALRFVSGAQLTRLCFSDTDNAVANARAARRALLRLVRLDVFRRLPRAVGGVRAGSAGFVYHLGFGGQRLASARGWQPERPRRRSVIPGRLFVQHALLVAELHVQLVEADRSGRFELLELNAEPVCWRRYDGVGGQRVMLKPDSYVRLGVGAYEDSYFVEVDRGTEGTLALERQLRCYLAHAASGTEQAARQVYPKVLWLAETPERVETIAEGIRRLPATSAAIFTVIEFDDVVSLMAGDGATHK